MTSAVQLTPIQATLLGSILSETQRIEGLRPHINLIFDSPQWAPGRIAMEDLAVGNGVRIGAWTDNDAAGRKQRSRGLHSLEDLGLVELISDRRDGSASHAKLTDAGRELAERLQAASNATPANATDGPDCGSDAATSEGEASR